MTHYDVDYAGLQPQAAHEKAIQDIKDYLGDHKYAEVTALAKKHSPMTTEQWAYNLLLSGIQGYPVRAWHDEIWPYG